MVLVSEDRKVRKQGLKIDFISSVASSTGLLEYWWMIVFSATEVENTSRPGDMLRSVVRYVNDVFLA